MTDILPAIIPYTQIQLEEEMNRVASFADTVQVDIADGVFASPKTWPYNGRDSVFFDELKSEDRGWPEWEKTEIELHMMVENPEQVLEDWIHTGIYSVVVHSEATNHMEEIIDMCRTYDIRLGIALKPSTDIEHIAPYVRDVDFIQCMGSDKIGAHGVPLDPRVVERVRTLHSLYPERIISVDIGVTEDTAQELVDAGATKLIVGGAILNAENPKEVFRFLESLC